MEFRSVKKSRNMARNDPVQQCITLSTRPAIPANNIPGTFILECRQVYTPLDVTPSINDPIFPRYIYSEPKTESEVVASVRFGARQKDSIGVCGTGSAE